MNYTVIPRPPSLYLKFPRTVEKIVSCARLQCERQDHRPVWQGPGQRAHCQGWGWATAWVTVAIRTILSQILFRASLSLPEPRGRQDGAPILAVHSHPYLPPPNLPSRDHVKHSRAVSILSPSRAREKGRNVCILGLRPSHQQNRYKDRTGRNKPQGPQKNPLHKLHHHLPGSF